MIGGFIGTTFRNFNISDFEKSILLLNSSSRRSQVVEGILERCKRLLSIYMERPRRKADQINEDLLSVMPTTTLTYVDAVRPSAHAIDSVYRCQLDQSHLSQVACVCQKIMIFLMMFTNVSLTLAKIQFQGLTGSISFHSDGDSLRSAAYDIVNLQFVPGSTPTLRNVGTWDRALKERLQLKRDLSGRTEAKSSQLHVVVIFVLRELDNPPWWLAAGNESRALPGQ